VDENLGFPLIAEALADVEGVTIKSAKVEFGEGVDDPALISLIGAKGWALLTKDRRIRYRPLEIEALVAAKIHAFFLGGRTKMTGPEQAELVRAKIELIIRRANQYRQPCLFTVSTSGVEPIEHTLAPPQRRGGRKQG